MVNLTFRYFVNLLRYFFPKRFNFPELKNFDLAFLFTCVRRAEISESVRKKFTKFGIRLGKIDISFFFSAYFMEINFHG